MQTDVSKRISRGVQLLPLDEQKKVLEFVESLGPTHRSLLDIVKEIEETLPNRVREELPTDGAENHDHYLYGAPKK